MTITKYRGESANLKVLAREIEADPHLAGTCSLTLTPLSQDRRDSLRHANWAEISVSVVSGLATNAVYDALKALIERARDRGPVDEVTTRPGGGSDEDTDGAEGVGER
ncbi:hypothetical protein [Streptomyces achromogenes]|uniref:hypothetical protein n=1 Tax=Streptomyces achromogenes TaxID=67255 RepID=UPI00367D9B41